MIKIGNAVGEKEQVSPFLKWAGGKRWLVSSQEEIAPTKFARYLEPFLGSAAVFFHLAPSNGILSDKNSELINAYTAIRDNWRAVDKELRKHQSAHSKAYYYEERSRRRQTPHTRAAQFIYLNRTCWNGLYRVNLKGEFNVPKGTKSQVILDTDDFETVAKRLKKVSIRCADFAATIASAKKGDFLFVDPPYTVKHNMNGFVKYNENIFSWDDQLRLSISLYDAHKRGVYFSMTNADHESVRELYSEFEKSALPRKTILAGKSEARGKTSELFVQNWR